MVGLYNKVGNAAINKVKSNDVVSETPKPSQSEEKEKSTETPTVQSTSLGMYNIFQILLLVVIVGIIMVVVFLSGSIAVSGWSRENDPGKIAKFFIFMIASGFWFIYLPYYYIVCVFLQGNYYTSNIYPLPSWLG